MKTNSKLIRLYTENLKNFKTISDNYEGDLDGPHLMHCWDEEYDASNKKILFIGKETNKWVDEARNGIKASIVKYKEFSFAQKKQDNTLIWKAIKEFNKIYNADRGDNCFLWSNVCKYSDYKGKGINFDEHKNIIKELNILEKEIKIVEPDIIIFFSGPDYDKRIQTQFENNVGFKSVVKSIPVKELAKLEHPSFPPNTYRTYHPIYLDTTRVERIKRWNFLQIIDAHIQGYDIDNILTEFSIQLKDIARQYNLEFEDKAFSKGEKFCGFYFSKPNWKYCALGFEFEANGFGDFFYGLCRKDMTIPVPISTIKLLNQRFKSEEKATEEWPYWKWF
jgi:hypothetical protein